MARGWSSFDITPPTLGFERSPNSFQVNSLAAFMASLTILRAPTHWLRENPSFRCNHVWRLPSFLWRTPAAFRRVWVTTICRHPTSCLCGVGEKRLKHTVKPFLLLVGTDRWKLLIFFPNVVPEGLPDLFELEPFPYNTGRLSAESLRFRSHPYRLGLQISAPGLNQ